MTDLQQRLTLALDDLTTALGPDRPVPVVGCLHCYSEDDLRRLSGSVDQLPERLFSSVAAKNPDHWDDFPALYRRLLPRILRTFARGELLLDAGLVATRMCQAGWRAWSLPERAAVAEVWQALLELTLHQHPSPTPIAEVLELMAVSTGVLQPWLDSCADTRTPSADRHLTDLIDTWVVHDHPAGLKLGFYGEMPAAPELLPWLRRLDPARLSETQRYLRDLHLAEWDALPPR
ncbi:MULTISPECIES: hypothetical protein [unclassified Kitasatospora]|uniref:hypothetical protein n=1 Tax=unclassified Kitasatospora TaxID=2633591 RepID=UPI0007C712FE|nr:MULTISPECIES: hypothetical protein [unclassified Kitasatospora]